MSPLTQSLLEQALDLEEPERATLAAALVDSLDHGPAEAGVDEAWDREIQRRVAELEGGSVEPIAWPEVRAQLFRGFE